MNNPPKIPRNPIIEEPNPTNASRNPTNEELNPTNAARIPTIKEPNPANSVAYLTIEARLTNSANGHPKYKSTIPKDNKVYHTAFILNSCLFLLIGG
ncbi:hypothetical protein [Fictibacillus barbaricus]|uniref:Uncharacterized protein n=1 Tax=Fictibacillus barbaricus TaxID=182136 RepID=A0ABU1U3Q6_9BACL|nr:hypothetical protein [Fictibacillus barbaricus]MDR7074125.1 hypothetical protein [Fictibacillus barbaricus]